MILRYAWRELKNSPRFCLLFVLNLALGLVGFIALDTLKRNFADRLEASARQMLTADLSLSSRRPFLPDEIAAAEKALPPGTESQTVSTLYSMVASPSRSALVELRAIEAGYPFYGYVRLAQGGLFQYGQELPPVEDIWVAPELLIQLDIQVGSRLKIGSREFRVADVIADDSSASLVGTSMAPRIYLAQSGLEAAGLVQFGSTVWRTRLYRLPAGVDVEQAKAAISPQIKDPGIRIKTYRESGQDDGRLLSYLSDYLGLVSLVALALAAIGASYLFRVYLDRKQSAIATLVSLGMTHERASLLYLAQLVLLGLMSALLACGLSSLLLPLAPRLVSQFSPLQLELGPSWPSYLLALALGAGGAVLVCLPLLARIRLLNPASLFSEQASLSDSWRQRTWAAYLPSLICFYALAVWQAHSIRVGSLFVGLLAVIILVFVTIAWLLLKLARRMKKGRSLSSRLALTYLSTHRANTISCFVALGLGSTLINLIPQIQHSIESELENPVGMRLPSLFMFDIQEDQIDGLREQVTAAGLSATSLSPMIMGRLSAVNGEPYRREERDDTFTREGEQEQRSRNRGVNLSYRAALSEGESLASGKFFTEPFTAGKDQLPELSLEENYAKRMGLDLGDKLTFDIQGLPIEGRVSSLRRVKWNTFQPNFFILIQPGAIDDAPKTFLMSLPSLDADFQARLQKQIVDNFPNISIIDVSKLVAKIKALVDQMSLVLIVMGWLTVLTGHVVVFSIAHQQAESRRWDHNLMKVLGAEFGLILRATLKEFAWLGAAAAILGSVLGIVASFVIAKFVFRGLWEPSLVLPVILGVLLLFVCLLTAYVATRRALAQKPSLQIDDN